MWHLLLLLILGSTIRDLGAPSFEVRHAAHLRLERWGPWATPALRSVTPSNVEAEQRIETLLQHSYPYTAWFGERLIKSDAPVPYRFVQLVGRYMEVRGICAKVQRCGSETCSLVSGSLLSRWCSGPPYYHDGTLDGELSVVIRAIRAGEVK